MHGRGHLKVRYQKVNKTAEEKGIQKFHDNLIMSFRLVEIEHYSSNLQVHSCHRKFLLT